MLLASEIVNNITHKLNMHIKTTFNLENSVCVCVCTCERAKLL